MLPTESYQPLSSAIGTVRLELMVSTRDMVTSDEWQLRVDLAACYRAVAMFGWDDLIYTHVSVKLPGTQDHFLINPYGLMFDEITASSLVKVDAECNPVLPTDYKVNPAGFVIHSALHAARDDVRCIVHTHTPAGVAVAAQKQGLLPISQQASVLLGCLAYHDYEGIAVRDDEKRRLKEDLGSAVVLILRNHGLLTVGPTIPGAFELMYTLERACQIQVLAQAGGAELIPISRDVIEGSTKAMMKLTYGRDFGEISWPAVRRKLDRINPGYAK